MITFEFGIAINSPEARPVFQLLGSDLILLIPPIFQIVGAILVYIVFRSKK